MLDASVALAWLLPEEGSVVIDALMDDAGAFPGAALAPRMIESEVANALWVAERRGRVTATLSDQLFEAFRGLRLGLIAESSALLDAARSLARKEQLAIYDSIYLEIARRENLPIATIDRRLEQVAIGIGVKTRGTE